MHSIHGTNRAHPTLPCGAHPDEFKLIVSQLAPMLIPEMVEDVVGGLAGTLRQVTAQDRHMCGHDAGMLFAIIGSAAFLTMFAEVAMQARLSLSASVTGKGSEHTRKQMEALLYSVTSMLEEIWLSAERATPDVIADKEGALSASRQSAVHSAKTWLDSAVQLYSER